MAYDPSYSGGPYPTPSVSANPRTRKVLPEPSIGPPVSDDPFFGTPLEGTGGVKSPYGPYGPPGFVDIKPPFGPLPPQPPIRDVKPPFGPLPWQPGDGSDIDRIRQLWQPGYPTPSISTDIRGGGGTMPNPYPPPMQQPGYDPTAWSANRPWDPDTRRDDDRLYNRGTFGSYRR